MSLMLLGALPLLAVLALFGLALASRADRPPAGLVDGRLHGCPATPNCVCSESGASGVTAVAPLPIGDRGPSAAWRRLVAAVVADGGRVTVDTGNYLAAEYRSRWLGFVDDFEARLNGGDDRIELRSASRVGKSDFGVNRARIARIRSNYLRRAPPAAAGRNAS